MATRSAVDFTGAHLAATPDGELVLTGMTTREPIQIEWSQFGDKWLATVVSKATNGAGASRESRLRQIDTDLRFWRRNFEDIGRDRDARTVYRALVEFQREHLMRWTDRDWWEAWVKGLGSAYGTDPYRPLWASAGLVVLFAAVYGVWDPFEIADATADPRGSKGAFALLYSVDTMVPFAVVTGVKEWGWRVKGSARWVVAGERELGTVFAALIAYNVGSYLI